MTTIYFKLLITFNKIAGYTNRLVYIITVLILMTFHQVLTVKTIKLILCCYHEGDNRMFFSLLRQLMQQHGKYVVCNNSIQI